MGVSFSHLGFYDLCHKQGAMRSPMLALGSQDIHEPAEQIRAYAERNRHPNLARDGAARSLFRDRYGVTEYTDCDLNEQADMKLDLNVPIEARLVGAYNAVLNSGTLEHVFNLAQSLENMHRLVGAGGALIHIAPVSWYEHGYVNFNPMLFCGIARANRYRLVAEAFHFRTDVLNKSEPRPALYVTYDGSAVTPQRQAVDRVLFESCPPGCLYMAAYIKTEERAFACPYDVQG